MIFSYPTTSPTTTITFRHFMRPERTERDYVQQSDTTTAGITIAQDYRAVTPVITVPWSNMPLADKVALEAFFETVGGMALPFKLTWFDATSTTVRFGEPELVFEEKSYQVYAITLKLQEIV